ncbi:hypothetical protein BANRA_03088 [Klebsiella pneumoniae]|nr:hypothetical protein [Klebsiella pneumoniae]VCZ15920.1 hypothetical protein BANRA_03088 [Klebsiella pneumoniae]
MKQARIEWQGQVRDVLVNERDQVRLDDGTVLKKVNSAGCRPPTARCSRWG